MNNNKGALHTADAIDDDQKKVLYIYSLYSDERHNTYLQYTAACALVYYITSEGVFQYNKEEYLVYDYKEDRRYIWESKKFMSDINILRDHGLLIRARSRSKTSRDVNAHQCTTEGHHYLKEVEQKEKNIREQFMAIRKRLVCRNGSKKTIHLYEKWPAIKCGHSITPIKGFLKKFDDDTTPLEKHTQYKPYFM